VTRLPTTCILAGGLGTRLGEQVADTPKPLLQIAGEPFLLHQLRLLAAHGAQHVVLCVGYLGELIEERIGSSQLGVAIDYSYDSPELDGTLGAIRRARALLPERFLVLYGDTYLRLDYEIAVRDWETSGCPAMMTVLHNEGRWDTSNVVYENSRVVRYSKESRVPSMQWIDYGLGGLQADALDEISADEHDLAALYERLSERGELFGFEVADRFYEIGTPSALKETEAFLRGQADGGA
jgi:NDP-sugar pyrophosphorylase family protein